MPEASGCSTASVAAMREALNQAAERLRVVGDKAAEAELERAIMAARDAGETQRAGLTTAAMCAFRMARGLDR